MGQSRKPFDLDLYVRPFPSKVFKACRAELLKPSNQEDIAYSSWWPSDAKPRHLIEKLVCALGTLVDSHRYAGGEWWCRIADDTIGKQLHFDKDELLVEKESDWVHPSLATVFYVTASAGGTLVLDQKISRDGRRLSPRIAREGVLVTPQENSYLVFPGDRRHGVLAAQRRKGSTRMTLLVNWWKQKPTGIRRRRMRTLEQVEEVQLRSNVERAADVGLPLDEVILKEL